MNGKNMKYPKCSNCEDGGRFIHLGEMCTAMYSPIVYDSDGNPVDGGANRRSMTIKCLGCGSSWIAAGTELEFAQGKVEYAKA